MPLGREEPPLTTKPLICFYFKLANPSPTSVGSSRHTAGRLLLRRDRPSALREAAHDEKEIESRMRIEWILLVLAAGGLVAIGVLAFFGRWE